ncbi:hypothetical protein BDV39DRAFT_176883 [Aspergillus sergii]|uniref:Transmembrane protein n=1 Tax=Aspergillus sergii TaxID=1034303 RepID=A0A5N6WZS3_9EURO|nr:hypothetical protein BDV39DRAFT_176883 [Aspergillus sergii]
MEIGNFISTLMYWIGCDDFCFFFFPLLFAALVGSKGGRATRANSCSEVDGWSWGWGVSDLCLGQYFIPFLFWVFLSLGWVWVSV